MHFRFWSSPLYSGGRGQDYLPDRPGDKDFERGLATAWKAAKNVTPVDVRTLQRHEVKLKIVKLRQGSGKDRQGMAFKAKGLKA